MTIYIDLVFFLNFGFDFLLLMTVNLILKRNSRLSKVVLGALIGSLSIFCLFLKTTTIGLFFIKFLIAILMVIITFKYNNLKYFLTNIIHLYLTSFIMGGFLYYLNLEYSLKVQGLTFVYKRVPLNAYILLILVVIVLKLYYRSIKHLKININNFHEVCIIIDKNHIIRTSGFLDTGSNLKDPITGKNIVLVIDSLIKDKDKLKKIYIPYTTLNGHELLECVKGKEIIIDNKKSRRILIGISRNDFSMDGVGCIISNSIMEDIK